MIIMQEILFMLKSKSKNALWNILFVAPRFKYIIIL